MQQPKSSLKSDIFPAGFQVVAGSTEKQELATDLANNWGVLPPSAEGGDLILELASAGPSALYFAKDPKAKLSIDFDGGEFAHRLKTSGKNQPLAKALGIPKGVHQILDLSAGLGGDLVLLAHLGCQVIALERHPAIYLILREALERTTLEFKHPPLLLQVAALDYLAELEAADCPEAIYFDPMYATGERKSLPRIEMQILEQLIGADKDQESVLELALKKAKDRVVVKRPAKAPFLLKEPTQSFGGQTTRYDMYLVKGKNS